MTPRPEIQFTLAMAKEGKRVEMPAETALALCERWLAVEDAPVAQVSGNVNWAGIIYVTDAMVGKRVRLVVEE